MNRKIIFMRPVSQKAAPLAVKFTKNPKSVMIDLTAPEFSGKATLFVKGDRLLSFEISPGRNLLDAGSIDAEKALCLIAAADKPLYYGSASGDTISCFSLLDEKKKQDRREPQKRAGTEPPRQAQGAKVLSDEDGEAKTLDEEKPEVRPFSEAPGFSGENFYASIKPQLDEIFVCYPEDNEPESVIPNSKWIRVDTKNSFYVIGITYNLDEPEFVCYGVAGTYDVKPPVEIADICSWVPADLSQKFGRGWWMIYQDASTGKTVLK